MRFLKKIKGKTKRDKIGNEVFRFLNPTMAFEMVWVYPED